VLGNNKHMVWPINSTVFAQRCPFHLKSGYRSTTTARFLKQPERKGFMITSFCDYVGNNNGIPEGSPVSEQLNLRRKNPCSNATSVAVRREHAPLGQDLRLRFPLCNFQFLRRYFQRLYSEHWYSSGNSQSWISNSKLLKQNQTSNRS
jgi:hypothetical protein